MRLSIWIAAFGALVLWSLLAWLGHALLDGTSAWVADQAEMISAVPAVADTVSWGFRTLGTASEIIVMIVWTLGSILIIGLAGLANRVFGKRRVTLRDLKIWRG